MCGRFVQYSDPEIYASQFDLDALCEAKPRYNVAPTQPVLAIRATDQGKRELVPLRWGLVLSESKGPDNRCRLKPADPVQWTLHPVSRQVNSPRNDGPELLDAVEAEQ